MSEALPGLIAGRILTNPGLRLRVLIQDGGQLFVKTGVRAQSSRPDHYRPLRTISPSCSRRAGFLISLPTERFRGPCGFVQLRERHRVKAERSVTNEQDRRCRIKKVRLK